MDKTNIEKIVELIKATFDEDALINDGATTWSRDNLIDAYYACEDDDDSERDWCSGVVGERAAIFEVDENGYQKSIPCLVEEPATEED